jgi:hypothetical protein
MAEIDTHKSITRSKELDLKGGSALTQVREELYDRVAPAKLAA